jgi:chromosome segregation ATPase
VLLARIILVNPLVVAAGEAVWEGRWAVFFFRCQSAMAALERQINEVKKEIKEVKEEIKEVKEEIKEVKEEIERVEAKIERKIKELADKYSAETDSFLKEFYKNELLETQAKWKINLQEMENKIQEKEDEIRQKKQKIKLLETTLEGLKSQRSSTGNLPSGERNL